MIKRRVRVGKCQRLQKENAMQSCSCCIRDSESRSMCHLKEPTHREDDTPMEDVVSDQRPQSSSLYRSEDYVIYIECRCHTEI
jgi:hypothetical protein